jgi:hypothetical protein
VIKYGRTSRQYTGSVVVDITATGTTGTVPDLDEGQLYYFAVTAVSESGTESVPSTEIAYRIPGEPQPSPSHRLSLEPLDDVTLTTDIEQFDVILHGVGTGIPDPEGGQPIRITATSSNPYLLPHPIVTHANGEPTARLTLKTSRYTTGTTFVQVTVEDEEGRFHVTSQRFAVVIKPSVAKQVMYREAESGSKDAFISTEEDSSAAGGQYVYGAKPGSGRVSVTFDVPIGGNYVLWCRVLSPNNATDSFYVALNDGPEEIYGTSQNNWSIDWQWSLFRVDSLGPPRVFKLNAGRHTFHFRAREAFTLLDALYLTQDMSFVPLTLDLSHPDSADGAVQVAFQGSPGYQYQVQASEDFRTWETLWSTPILETQEYLSYLDNTATTRQRRFYRVEIQGGLEPVGSVK